MKKSASLSILAQKGFWLAASTALLVLFSTGCATNDRKAQSNTRLKLGCQYPAELLRPAAWKASWSPRNQRLAYGKQGGGIAILDLATHRVTDLVSKGQDSAWSPDGKYIAYVISGGEAYLSEEVWLVPTAGGNPVKVGDGGFPTWSADCSQVIFHSRKLNQILSAKVSALDEPPAVFFKNPLSWYPAISPDGSCIAFGVPDKLVVVDRGTGEILARLATPGERGLLPCWSPDGRQVAFGGFAGSRAGLWIFDVERGGAFQVAKKPGCTMPAWSPDGKSLAFDLRGRTNEIWLVKTKDFPRHPPLTKQLLAQPTAIASKDANGMTPLHIAAAKGQRDEVESLLANGADVNARANDGATPLHWAVYNGHKDVVELLLASKAPVNARGRDGYTPLHWAAAKGDKEIAELLLKNQADVNARNDKGETPVNLAQSKHHPDLVEWLRQHGGQ